MKTITILIADDHAMVRAGLRSLLESQDDLRIVGEAEDGNEAIELTRTLTPDVIIMDLMMPEKNGIEATREIQDVSPTTKIIILTSFSTSDGIVHALKAGAAGAILKSDDFSTLVAAIRTVFAGGQAISPDIRKLLDEDPPVPDLTARQEEILDAIVRGQTYTDIALRCNISEATVKGHIALICSKLGAANRSEAIAIALRKHLLKI